MARFSVGDRVRAVRDVRYLGLKKHDVGTVIARRDDADFPWRVSFDTRGTLTVRNSQIARALEEKKMRFSVGDRVRLTEEFGAWKCGDEAIIDMVDEDDDVQPYRVKFENGAIRWIRDRFLERAAGDKHQYKVGDRIRMITELPSLGLVVGDVGRIAEVERGNDTLPYYVRFDRDDMTWWVNDEQIEPEKPRMRFEIGDRVRATEDVEGGYVSKGSVGKIISIDMEDKSLPWLAQFDGGGKTSWCTDDQLEPESPTPPAGKSGSGTRFTLPDEPTGNVTADGVTYERVHGEWVRVDDPSLRYGWAMLFVMHLDGVELVERIP